MTPLYPQKLALTPPIGGGRSVGIVRLRTKATEFSLVPMRYEFYITNSLYLTNEDIFHIKLNKFYWVNYFTDYFSLIF